MHILLFHSVRWSKYKGAVFSALYKITRNSPSTFEFVQIADSGSDRAALSPVDLSYHQYPHTVLFPGYYDSVPKARLIFTLVKIVVGSRAHLVLLPGYNMVEYWAMLLFCLLTKKPVAVFCDSTINDRPQTILKGMLKRVFFKLCDGFFTYGVRSSEYLVHYGADPAKIYQRCQAAALPADYSEEAAHAARLGNGGQPTRYLYVGRLSREKGLEDLIAAFSQGADSSAELAIVGGGPEKERLMHLARTHEVSERVKFLGAMQPPQLAEQYARATCLVLPSYSEPWGLVVNEALHYGCPVIVSEVCGCVPELVHSGVTGHTFAPGNVSQLARLMEQAAAQWADRFAVSQACMAVIRLYTPERAAQEIHAGCVDLLGPC